MVGFSPSCLVETGSRHYPSHLRYRYCREYVQLQDAMPCHAMHDGAVCLGDHLILRFHWYSIIDG